MRDEIAAFLAKAPRLSPGTERLLEVLGNPGEDKPIDEMALAGPGRVGA